MAAQKWVNFVSTLACWYGFSTAATVTSKQLFVPKIADPVLITFIQYMVGTLCCIVTMISFSGDKSTENKVYRYIPRLGLRFPERGQTRRLLFVSAAYCAGHLLTNWSIFAMAASFAQTIKATEPVFTVIVGMVFTSTVYSKTVYVSLLPIVGGVMMASFAETSFDWKGVCFCLISNFCFAVRNIGTKFASLDNKSAFFWCNIISLFLLMPIYCLQILLFESNMIWSLSFGNIKIAFSCGLSHFMYNWASFQFLTTAGPVTHSVANAMRRVFVIVGSLVYFRNPISRVNAAGTIMALAGAGLYAFLKNQGSTSQASNGAIPKQLKSADRIV